MPGQGSYLEVGRCCAWSAIPSGLEALVVIDQSQVQFVRPGQPVRLQVDASPGHILRGRIVELARLDLKVAPPELAEQSELLVHFDREGIPRPAATSYQARVELDEEPAPADRDPRPCAKIAVDPQPLGIRLYPGCAPCSHSASRPIPVSSQRPCRVTGINGSGGRARNRATSARPPGRLSDGYWTR